MRIKRLLIKNYRAIKEIELSPGALCTLVGENNSGKTTILRALNIMLGDSWPSDRSFDESDFHMGNTAESIVIEVYFDEPLKDTRGTKPEVAGFRLSCSTYKRATPSKLAGELRTEFVCIGPKGGEVHAEAYKQGSPPPAALSVTNALRDQVPVIYVDVLRDYARHSPSTRWSPLRRIIDHIGVSFTTDKSKVEVPTQSGTVTMTRQEAYKHYSKEALDALRIDELTELEDSLEKNALEQMGIDSSAGSVKLGFSSYDPKNAYRNLELIVSQLGVESRAEEVGAGLQSSIVIAAFRTYEQLRRTGAIFAIEEPEAFLHPQRARFFASILERISESDNQVLVATHSPYFVKLHVPETLCLVRRSGSSGTKVIQGTSTGLTPDQRTALKMQTEVNAERGEMLFSRKILFVEGQTERVAMPFVFEQMGVDANREGISVVDCGSKDSIPFFAKIAGTFGIPFVILADLDPKQPQRPTARLQAICPTDNLFLLDPDFEGVCGYKEGNKILGAYNYFHSKTKEQLPEQLVVAIERLAAL